MVVYPILKTEKRPKRLEYEKIKLKRGAMDGCKVPFQKYM